MERNRKIKKSRSNLISPSFFCSRASEPPSASDFKGDTALRDLPRWALGLVGGGHSFGGGGDGVRLYGGGGGGDGGGDGGGGGLILGGAWEEFRDAGARRCREPNALLPICLVPSGGVDRSSEGANRLPEGEDSLSAGEDRISEDANRLFEDENSLSAGEDRISAGANRLLEDENSLSGGVDRLWVGEN